ncbi:hypothetical protein [Asticcacaulis sp. YBE204]|nr:hypothetical protein [Asticcacaulis sp. YBE204]ESQ79309.1 hypothetical protein AEYBE204_09880 [Asticcacaulis sp. YBE204]
MRNLTQETAAVAPIVLGVATEVTKGNGNQVELDDEFEQRQIPGLTAN